MLVARVRTCEKWRKVYRALKKNPRALKDASHRLDGYGQAVADFFEVLAIYYSKHVFPRDMIWHTYSWYLEYYWTLLQDGITELQNELKDVTLYSRLPELIEAMTKENIKKEAPTFAKTKDEILKIPRHGSYLVNRIDRKRKTSMSPTNQSPTSPSRANFQIRVLPKL